MKNQVTQIKNGISLHCIETPIFKTNLVSVFITSKLNRDNITKDALIPAVLRRGTKKLKTQEEISKLLENMYGASFDCGIEKSGDNHVLKFYLESLNDSYIKKSENLMKNSISTLLEIVFNPYLEDGKFKNDYVESEKNNLKQIIEAKIDNKDAYAYTRAVEEMFKDMPYSLYKYGYIEDLESINSENLYKHYENLLKRSKIDIFISGNVQNDEIINIIKENENILNLQDRTPDFYVNNETSEKNVKKDEEYFEEKMNIAQGKLVIGLNILTNEKESRFPALLYNTILGDSANSKLFQNVREKAHLAYTARSGYVRTKQCIFIRAGIEIENYEKALEIIKEQIDDMKNGKFNNEDIENAKKYLISSIDSIEEEQDTEITYYFGQELSNEFYTPEEYKQKIKSISKEDIEEIANKIQINTIFFLRN